METRSKHLAVSAEMAGLAFGCLFSSSSEYEAALIAERRMAGRYPLVRRGQLSAWMLFGTAVVVFSIFL